MWFRWIHVSSLKDGAAATLTEPGCHDLDKGCEDWAFNEECEGASSVPDCLHAALRCCDDPKFGNETTADRHCVAVCRLPQPKIHAGHMQKGMRHVRQVCRRAVCHYGSRGHRDRYDCLVSRNMSVVACRRAATSAAKMWGAADVPMMGAMQ